jgi:hypothetical protein
MALLTDGQVSTLEDLQGIDASVLEVARVERIDLDRKLLSAQDEIGLEVKRFVLEHGLEGRLIGSGGEAAVDRVVVTPGLKRWHSLRTLANVYSDAYFSQLNDRYRNKWEHYRELAEEASDLLFATGVGAVASGVSRAAPPVVEASGIAGAQETYFIAVALEDAGGREGAPSETVAFSTNELPRVRLDEPAPAGWGFHVYAGLSDATMSKQTESAIEAGQDWVSPGGGLAAGAPRGDGQAAEYFLRRERIWRRG